MKTRVFKQLLTAIAVGAISIGSAQAATAGALISAADEQPMARVGTGFGINSFRGFNTNAATQYVIDGAAIAGEPLPSQMGLGTRVNALLDASTNATVTEGNALTVFIDNALIGPISAITPQFKVLGQALTITSDTVLVDIPANNLSALQVGQVLEVAGQIDANNSFVATRIALKQSVNNWRLTGYLTAANSGSSTASIGSQAISFVGIAPSDCPATLIPGLYVEVRATPITPFAANQLINTVTRLHCGAPTPPGTPGAPAAVDGLVSAVTEPPATEFKVNNLTISYAPTTFFRNGNSEDIDLGVRVEVEGIYVDASNIAATKIRFIRPTQRFQANLLPSDVVPNVSVTVFGKVIKFTPQTRDEDGIAANGLSALAAVEVRTYSDSAGNLYATRIRDRGNIRPDRFKLAGAAGDIVVLTSFKIVGVNVNTGTSAFFNASGQSITPAAFYNELTPERMVEISSATYDAGSNTLSGGDVAFIDDVFANRAGIANAVNNALVSGTLTEVALDAVFAAGFE